MTPAAWCLLAWLALANAIAFAALGIDKRRARRGQRRIAERTLWGWAAAGGFVGAWLGASYFRHKTRKTSFRVKLALATVVGALGSFAAWNSLS